MKKLFLPAIYLMDRFRLGSKFTLINIIFSIPLILLSYGFAAQLLDGIRVTESEREGLVILNKVFDLTKASQAFREVKTLALVRDIPANTELANKKKVHVDTAFEEIELLGLNESGKEKILDQFESAKTVWGQVNKEQIGAAGYGLTYVGFNDFMLKPIQLLDTVSQVSGISRDPNPETVTLLRLIVETIPKIAEPMGEARGFGAYGTTLDYLNSGTATKMDEIFDELIKAEGELKQATAIAIESSPMFKQELGNVAAAGVQAIRDAQLFLEEKTIIAESLDYPTAQYFDEQSRNIDQVYQIVYSAIPVVDHILAERLRKQETQLYLLYGALAFIYLLIFYLFGGFFLSIKSSLNRFASAADKVAAGDLREKIQLSAKDEIQELASTFNSMSLRFSELIAKVLAVSGNVGKKSSEVEGIAAESSTAIERQLDETTLVATAMNEMAATVQDVARNSAETASLANTASEQATLGQKVVDTTLNDITGLAKEIDQTSNVINRVSEDSDNISSVLEVIKGISGQTNLLALNAAIEAARAGEQGRGFAVVADEVRTLAQRTHNSVEEIETTINQLQSGVADAVSTMKASHEMASGTLERSSKVGDALIQIVSAVENIVGMTDQIATAAEEQSAIADEINNNITRISEVGRETEKGAQDTSAATHDMAELVGELQALVNTFKV